MVEFGDFDVKMTIGKSAFTSAFSIDFFANPFSGLEFVTVSRASYTGMVFDTMTFKACPFIVSGT